MIHRFHTLTVACCLLLAHTSVAHATALSQVLLQGPDPDAMEAALEAAGGQLTHRLPIIGAIGGLIDANAVNVLAQHPSIDRAIEDLNPPSPEDDRDCVVAGDLDTATEGKTISWRLHNFGQSPVAIESLVASWPEYAGHGELKLKTQTSHKLGTYESAVALNQPAALAPGINTLTINFPDSKATPQQNELAVSLKLAKCDITLPKAYADNHGDFYFPSIVGADLLHEAGLTGEGVTVAVLDSGLWDHPDLTQNIQGETRIPESYDAIVDSSERPLIDLGGHGSHMSSIIANSRAVTRPGGRGYLGIAPNARLIPIRAFAEAGDGDFLDIIRGIQWTVDNKERLNIGVLNMSLSAVPRFHYWEDPINQAVLKAWQAGIVVVAAAGNDGPEWSTVGSPGNNPYVITVGAVTDSWTPEDRSDDYIPDFSSRGPTPVGHIKPDVVAPGGHITGLLPPDSRLARENPHFILKTGEFVSTGSSQAAAVVSGIVALLLESDPALNNDQVKCLLTTSAEPAINRDGRLAYSTFIQGNGYVNAGRALTIGERSCEQQSLNIDAAVAGTEQLYGPAIRLDGGSPSLPGLADVSSDMETEKGESDNRRWGVREHLERLDPVIDEPQAKGVPVDWAATFELERQKLKALSSQPQ